MPDACSVEAFSPMHPTAPSSPFRLPSQSTAIAYQHHQPQSESPRSLPRPPRQSELLRDLSMFSWEYPAGSHARPVAFVVGAGQSTRGLSRGHLVEGKGERPIARIADEVGPMAAVGCHHALGEESIRSRYGNLFDMYKRITDENPYQPITTRSAPPERKRRRASTACWRSKAHVRPRVPSRDRRHLLGPRRHGANRGGSHHGHSGHWPAARRVLAGRRRGR